MPHLLLAVAALLALSWQSFVAQTHLHYAPPAFSQAATAPPAVQNGDQRSPDLPINCPLCQELATAGQYLLPSLPAIELPDAGEVWLSLASLPELTVREASHIWRSRAPPQHLQA